LQVDRAFDIGDWLEVTISGAKTVGQVKEITWRATVMVGWADELIILPNRTLSNSQIANFSLGDQPIIRSQMFRVRYGTDLQVAKAALLAGLKDVKVIRSWPEPLVLITEMNESWVGLKLVYFIENFGSQFTIGDQVIEAALQSLLAKGIEPAPQRMDLHGPKRPA
jgi:small-conductance mechanosensitive channel